MTITIAIAIRRLIAIAAIAFIAALAAAEEPKPPSDAERISILKAQNELLMAQDAVKQSAEYQRFAAAQSALSALARRMFSERGIREIDTALCLGPSDGACADVAKGEIAFRPIPKPAPTTQPKETKETKK